MKNICVVTGTRAEYGLLRGIMTEIERDESLRLQIIATAAHLSHEFGYTVDEIEQDGFTVDRRVEMLLSGDTAGAITKSTGLALIGFSDALEDLRPDLMVLLGDRYEILAAATAALFHKIPLAHVHGGETTEGAFDEAIRHAVTKMSHLHFTTTEVYRRRVIQLGEQPERVFNVGGLGVDAIKRIELLGRDELEESLGHQFGPKNLLVTYHPVTLGERSSAEEFGELLTAIDRQKETRVIFTKPNADTDGRAISDMIDNYVAANRERTISFVSMGQQRFFSALQFVDAMLGNSSSGLLEAPMFRIGTVNIGDRQKGRIGADSVIDCEPTAESISSALETLYSPEFQENLRTVVSPYGEGGAAVKIVQTIAQTDLRGIVKKSFHDLEASRAQ
ncbi:MAG: UDP-N-acetylglucosamine 2-epimerase (hydrolyzing) [Planctomycetes bacterium]|nr:UDP-N-acetylglucosamine 2-epimerase (hydrolyzing) [Planctomycetota bacterium]